MSDIFDVIEELARRSNEVDDFVSTYKTVQFFYDDCLTFMSYDVDCDTIDSYVNIEVMIDKTQKCTLQEIFQIFRENLNNITVSCESEFWSPPNGLTRKKEPNSFLLNFKLKVNL